MTLIQSLLADVRQHERSLEDRLAALKDEQAEARKLLAEVRRHRARLERDHGNGEAQLPFPEPEPEPEPEPDEVEPEEERSGFDLVTSRPARGRRTKFAGEQ